MPVDNSYIFFSNFTTNERTIDYNNDGTVPKLGQSSNDVRSYGISMCLSIDVVIYKYCMLSSEIACEDLSYYFFRYVFSTIFEFYSFKNSRLETNEILYLIIFPWISETADRPFLSRALYWWHAQHFAVMNFVQSNGMLMQSAHKYKYKHKYSPIVKLI